jgi:hypothetical protein
MVDILDLDISYNFEVGQAVAQLAEALCYKPKGWRFSIDLTLWASAVWYRDSFTFLLLQFQGRNIKNILEVSTFASDIGMFLDKLKNA